MSTAGKSIRKHGDFNTKHYMDGAGLEEDSSDVSDLQPTTDHVKRTWKKSKCGRPTLVTAQITHQMCLLIAGGTPLPVAALACGVRGWRDWVRTGREHEALGYEPGYEEGQSPYVDFLWSIDEARAALEASMALRITQAAIKDWRAAAYTLERRFADRWREKKEIAVTVKRPDEIAKEMSSEELEAAVVKALGLQESKELIIDVSEDHKDPV